MPDPTSALAPKPRHWHTADGLRLAGEAMGPADGPAVVLLHGGGQTRYSWAGAMQALAGAGWRVVSFDARGHGESGWSASGAYELDDRARDLAAVVNTIAAPVALVGASLGGATAIHAVAAGLDAAALVLVDIVPEPEAAGINRIVSFMRGHGDGFATLAEAADAVAAYNPTRPRPRDPSGLMRNLRRRDDGRFYWHWDPRIVADDPRHHHAIVQRSARCLHGRRDLPVLLVRGLKSDVVSDAGVAAFRAMVPHLEVTDVAAASHMVAGDRNDAFNAGVIDFLARHLPPRSLRNVPD